MGKSRRKFQALIVCSLIFGSLTTIAGQYLDLSVSQGHAFHHPYFLTGIMFIGEFLCLGIYAVFKKDPPSHTNPLPNEINFSPRESTSLSHVYVSKLGKYAFCLSSFIDLISSALSLIGLLLTSPTVYMMLRSFTIVVAAIYTVFILKLKIFRHRVCGVFFTILGIVLVGLASIFSKSSSSENQAAGVFIIIISQFFAGGHIIAQHIFFFHIEIEPLQAVGIEGLAGIGYCSIMLLVFNLVHCSQEEFCHGGYLENSIQAFGQMESINIVLLLVLFIIGASLSNFAGASITKRSGPLARVTVDTCKAVLVWIFSILVEWEEFSWLQLVGFILLLLGTLMYNEILRIPWFGFREAIEKRRIYMKGQSFNLDRGREDSIGFVPGAVFMYYQFKEVTGKGSAVISSM